MEAGWTIETLKEFFEQKFDSLSEAVNKQEISYNERFASVNEFRLQLSDQSRTFMPRLETENTFKSHEKLHENLNEKLDGIIKAINDRLDGIVKKMDKIENMKAGGNVVWAYIIATISLIATVISVAFSIMANQ